MKKMSPFGIKHYTRDEYIEKIYTLLQLSFVLDSKKRSSSERF